MAPTGQAQTVILGNGQDALRLARAYTAKEEHPRRQVVVGLVDAGLTNGVDNIDLEPVAINLTDEHWLDFQDFYQRQLPVGTLVLAFGPSSAASSQSDEDPTQDVLIPLMRCVKTALFYWRRETIEEKRLIIIGPRGGEDKDQLANLSRNATIGFFRSLVVRIRAVGVRAELVLADLSDVRDLDSIKTLLEAPSDPEPRVHIVEEGKITTQSPSIGACYSTSISLLHKRINSVINLSETIRMLHFRYRSWYTVSGTPNSGLQTLAHILLSNAIGYGCYYLALRAFESGSNVLAFFISILVARLATLPTIAILAQVVSKTLFDQYLGIDLVRAPISHPTLLFTGK